MAEIGKYPANYKLKGYYSKDVTKGAQNEIAKTIQIPGDFNVFINNS